MRSLSLTLIALCVLASCANPINQNTAQRYYAAGEAALRAGDLITARENFRRALINAQVGNLGSDAESQAAYKLARVQGNLCEYDNADKTFQYALDAQVKRTGENSPLTFPLRVELAQLSFDTGHFDKAVGYFDKAFAVGGKTLETSMQTGYADLLDDYAVALAAIRNTALADSVRARSNAVRQSASGSTQGAVKSKSEYVPYPKTCK
jgi:tetratricopeptide (TPR) repeat protein